MGSLEDQEKGAGGEGGRSSYLARRRKTTPRRAARKEAQWRRTNLRGESGGSRVRRTVTVGRQEEIVSFGTG